MGSHWVYILVHNGITLSLHFGTQWEHIEFTFWYTMGSHWVYILVRNGITLILHFGTQWDPIELIFWYAMGSHWVYILVRSGIPLSLHCSINHYKIINCDIKVNLYYVIWSRSSAARRACLWIPLRTKIILLHVAYFSSLWTWWWSRNDRNMLS